MKDFMFFTTLCSVAFCFLNLGILIGKRSAKNEFLKAAKNSGVIDIKNKLYAIKQVFKEH